VADAWKNEEQQKGVKKMRIGIPKILAAMAAMLFAMLAYPAMAQELDLTKKSTYDQILAWANEPLDTAKYKKEGKLKIGVSAGYLSNAWINFTAQMIKYEASTPRSAR
jgi:hypothetical protein